MSIVPKPSCRTPWLHAEHFVGKGSRNKLVVALNAYRLLRYSHSRVSLAVSSYLLDYEIVSWKEGDLGPDGQTSTPLVLPKMDYLH